MHFILFVIFSQAFVSSQSLLEALIVDMDWFLAQSGKTTVHQSPQGIGCQIEPVGFGVGLCVAGVGDGVGFEVGLDVGLGDGLIELGLSPENVKGVGAGVPPHVPQRRR